MLTPCVHCHRPQVLEQRELENQVEALTPQAARAGELGARVAQLREQVCWCGLVRFAPPPPPQHTHTHTRTHTHAHTHTSPMFASNWPAPSFALVRITACILGPHTSLDLLCVGWAFKAQCS